MRAARRLIIALVILLGLLAAADRIAVGVAESKVADRLQSDRGLSRKPSVGIEGFPFLTQLAGGSLDHVTVHATDMVLQDDGGQSVTVSDFRADLRDVKLEDDYSTAVAGSATGTALISYAELSSVLPNHPAVSYAGNGRVHASVQVPVLSRQVSGTAGLDFKGDAIGLTGVGDLSGLSGIPGLSGSVAAGLVSQYLGARFQLSGLPEGLEVTGVQAVPDGVSVSVAGSGVSLTGTAG